MPTLSISGLGSTGLFKDTNYLTTPDNGWNEASNVKFVNGCVEKAKGWDDAVTVSGVPEIAPYYVRSIIPPSGASLWVYAGLNKVYATDNGTAANITRQADSTDVDYSATVDENWDSCVLSGVLVLNNANDTPQRWVTSNHLSTKLADLDAWPGGMRATVLGGYKTFLVAAGINEGSGLNPYLIRWSGPAEPGLVPETWDYTDITNLAGRVEISTDASHFQSMLELRDTNILYKEHSIIGMDYVGGNSIFVFRTLFEQVGILGKRCVASFFGRHLVFGDGDIVIHDGQQIESPLDKKIVRHIFTAMDGTKRNRCFVAIDYTNKEAWLCYSTGQSVPNQAVVWNYRDNTSTIVDLGAAAHIGVGEVSESVTLINDLTGLINDEIRTPDDFLPHAFQQRLVLANPISSKLYVLNETEQRDSAPFTAMVTRHAVPFRDQGGNLDTITTKFVREIYLNISGTEGGIVTVMVSGRKVLEDPVLFNQEYLFTIGTSRKINCRVSGRIIDLKIQSSGNITWKLSGYTMVYEYGGLN